LPAPPSAAYDRKVSCERIGDGRSSLAARILVGTCSWTERSLVACGRFYPPEIKTPEERLRFYAQQFPIVEVDSTYYGLPSERNAALWVERTPEEFLFDIKAFSVFTHHPTPVASLPKDVREALPTTLHSKKNVYYRDIPSELRQELWQRFASALLPLDSAGKLGVVLLQYPPWFMPGRESKDYILEAQERLPQYRVAVEFRNNRWLSDPNRDRTLGFLRQNRLPFVCVDEPQGLTNSVPPMAEPTAEIGLVRFHGRNRETWAKKGATTGERFDYLYSEQELTEWLPAIERLAGETQEMHLLMNNCVQDKAVVNARQLALMLSRSNKQPATSNKEG
jgi:uncharacterized protein YecE (DUF72 family)